MKTLLTGVAGTEKSTLVKALNERGVTAIDLHDVPGLFFYQNIKTKNVVKYASVQSRKWFDEVGRFCNIDMVKEILNQQNDIVMAGISRGNQKEFVSLFDKVILLQCDPETLIYRMKTRTNKSGYGKTKIEQEYTIDWREVFDPETLSMGAIPINTKGEIDDVVQKIIETLQG